MDPNPPIGKGSKEVFVERSSLLSGNRMLCGDARRIERSHSEGTLPHAIGPPTRIAPAMEHCRDENPFLLHRVQHKIRKAPEQCLAGSPCDELVPLRKTAQAPDRSIKRE